MKAQKDEQCLLCRTAIRETAIVLRNKLNQAISDVFPILWKIKDKQNMIERNTIILEEIKTLIKKHSNLEGFYRLLYEKICLYIEKVGIDTLPRFLSTFSEHTSRTIEFKLMDILSDFGVIFIDNGDEVIIQRYNDIKKTVISINFHDSTDCEIFCELTTILCDEMTIEFYTNDKEFKNKFEKAYSKLEQEMSFKSSWMNLNYVE